MIRQIEGVKKALDSGDNGNADHAEKLAVLEEDLKILESDALLEKAARFNLDLTNTAGVGPWMTHAVTLTPAPNPHRFCFASVSG